MCVTRLEENVYNRLLSRDDRKFKLWTSAGLMLSYCCSSRCACCYVFSGPGVGGSNTEMSETMALECWRGLWRLAGGSCKIHLTGGEPFVDFDRLARVLRLAQEEGLGGLEKVETNAYWCTDVDHVRYRFELLCSLGLKKLQVSSDIYHQEYVPIDRVRLAQRVGREVFGEGGLQVRWRDFAENPVLVGPMNSDNRSKCFVEQLSKRPERLVGRAAEQLAPLLEQKPLEEFVGANCSRSFLGARHVHVDGAGNVFSGTCIGIVLGNVGNIGLDALWKQFDVREHPIISILVANGPVGLLELAEHVGYRQRKTYSSKCHLCYEIRRFFFYQGLYGAYLGPGECYGQSEPRHQRV